jgi:hypothetical protein
MTHKEDIQRLRKLTKQQITIPIMYTIENGNYIYDYEQMRIHFENDLINLSLKNNNLNK